MHRSIFSRLSYITFVNISLKYSKEDLHFHEYKYVPHICLHNDMSDVSEYVAPVGILTFLFSTRG